MLEDNFSEGGGVMSKENISNALKHADATKFLKIGKIFYLKFQRFFKSIFQIKKLQL